MDSNRLKILADNLEKDANDPKGMKFDLGDWISVESDRWFSDDFVPQRNCGTIGCAIGLAGMLPEFNKMGFHLKFGDKPVYKSYQNWDAVKEFFDLSAHEAEFLFYSSSYSGKKTGKRVEKKVAKRIRKFIKADGIYKDDFKVTGVAQ